MNIYSWFTSKEKYDGGWYKCQIKLVFPKNTFICNTYPFYKPNRKGKPKAKRNKLFNHSTRSIYGRKWPDVKKILKNTIYPLLQSWNSLQEIYNYEKTSKEMALQQSAEMPKRNGRSGTEKAIGHLQSDASVVRLERRNLQSAALDCRS